MIYLLYGGDELSIDETLSSLKAEVGSAEVRDFNITSMRGAALTPEELFATCATVPFLSDKRLVIVEGLLSLFEAGGPGPTGRWEGLSDRLSALPDTTDLVFSDGRLSQSNPLLGQLRPLAKTLTFPSPTARELPDWIRERAAKRGVRIEPRAISAMADAIGGNLRIMDMELQKLSLYRSGEEVRHQDVEELVAYVREANIFGAVDAVLEGRPGMAIRVIHQLLDSGRTPPYVIAMIARQVRFLLLAKELMEQKVPAADMGRRLELSGYPLRKTMEQAPRLTKQRLMDMHRKLLEADLSVKSGPMDEQLVLDILVAELVSGPRAG